MVKPWMLDELAHAGPEHLDPAFVAGFDRKQGYPDFANDLAVLAATRPKRNPAFPKALSMATAPLVSAGRRGLMLTMRLDPRPGLPDDQYVQRHQRQHRAAAADAALLLIHDALIQIRAMAYSRKAVAAPDATDGDYHERIRMISDVCTRRHHTV